MRPFVPSMTVSNCHRLFKCTLSLGCEAPTLATKIEVASLSGPARCE